MSRIVLTGTAAPSNPASGKGSVYLDTDGQRPRHLSASGVTSLMADAARFNRIRNSGFWFAQRQVPGTLTTYSNLTGRSIAGADGWGVTNENASIQYRRVDTSSAAESKLLGRHYGEWTKITAAGKICVSQVLEGTEAQSLRGRAVRLQVWARQVTTSNVWRLGLLYLTSAGTIDTIPATFISAFNGASADPTFGTNLSFSAPRSSPVQVGDGGTITGNALTCTLTSAWTRYGFVTTLPGDFKNLIVVMFSDTQINAANGGLAMTAASLCDGEEINDWQPGDVSDAFSRVQRFYQKTFLPDTNPAQNAGIGGGAVTGLVAKAGATALAGFITWRYNPPMRAQPTTITTYSPGAASAQIRRLSGAAAADMTATAVANSNANSVDFTGTGDAAGTAGDQCAVHATADAEL